MKRLHIHISVDNLQKSIEFYSTLFGEKPTKEKSDYAKWQLEDPSVNFAISARGAKTGIDHLGIQVDDADELESLRERLKQANVDTFGEGETVCCYSESDKTWTKDPSGIAWESYRNMNEVEFFNNVEQQTTSCCTPKTPENSSKGGCC